MRNILDLVKWNFYWVMQQRQKQNWDGLVNTIWTDWLMIWWS